MPAGAHSENNLQLSDVLWQAVESIVSNVELVQRVSESAELVGQRREIVVGEIQPAHILGHSKLHRHLLLVVHNKIR